MITMVISYAVCQNALAGAQGGWFPELFTASRRASGASLAYQISAMVSGFTPFITTLLYVSLRLGRPGPAVQPVRADRPDRRHSSPARPSVPQERRIAAEAADPVPVSVDHPLPDHQSPIQGVPVTDTATYTQNVTDREREVAQFAYRMRHHVLDMGEAQGQGYVGQALGAADMFAAIYANRLRYRPDDPHWDERDRFLLSTGHYAIGLYAALAEAGIVPIAELDTYGSDDSRLPMSGMATYTPGMEISGGSLGHGLPVAVGLALGLRYRGSNCPGLQLPLRRRAERRLDLGGRHGCGPPPARQPDCPGRHQRPPGRRSDRRGAVHRAHPRQVDGVRLVGPAGSTGTTSSALVGGPRPGRRRGRPGRAAVASCSATPRSATAYRCWRTGPRRTSCASTKHEWQPCRDQLSLGAPEGSAR